MPEVFPAGKECLLFSLYMQGSEKIKNKCFKNFTLLVCFNKFEKPFKLDDVG